LKRNCKDCGGSAVCLRHNRSSKYRCPICKLEKANAIAIASLAVEDITMSQEEAMMDLLFLVGPQ
jgi:Zn finger protein HypA/HybF involved in hydrogenase expression